MTAPVILTERLQLRPLVPGDAPELFGYRADPRVCRFQSFEPGTLHDVEAFLARVEPTFDVAGTWFQFAICLRSSGKLIGDLGMHFFAEDSRQVELGVTVSPDNQGLGYGTEAVIGALDLLLGSLRKHRVSASVDPRNTPSVALLERVGMRLEAHFHKSLWFKGEWADDMVFALLDSEWPRPSI